MSGGPDPAGLESRSFRTTRTRGQKDADPSAFRKRLARIDPKGLTHEEWLSREILDWQLATYASGAERFWSFFQITPYSSPFRSFQQVFATVNFKAEKDRRRYLDLLRQYARAMGQLRTNLETQRAQGIMIPKAEIDAVVGLVRLFARKPEESPFAVSSERLEKFYPEGAASFQAEVQLIEPINPSQVARVRPDTRRTGTRAPSSRSRHYRGARRPTSIGRLHTTRRPPPRRSRLGPRRSRALRPLEELRSSRSGCLPVPLLSRSAFFARRRQVAERL